MKKIIKRGDVYWITFDPTIGTEINKIRPGLIVSNDAGNKKSSRIIVAPITSKAIKLFPFEVSIEVKNRKGKILLDQIRTVDKIRLGKYITSLNKEIMDKVNIALKIVLAIP